MSVSVPAMNHGDRCVQADRAGSTYSLFDPTRVSRAYGDN